MAIKASATITLSSIRDLQSCTRYYLLQSSTSAKPAKPTAKPPGGNWVTAEPTYTSGSTNSLYFCDLNVFSDGTFAYSEVSLSSSYEAAKAAYNKAQSAQDSVDGLQIGGRNLLQDTTAPSLTKVHAAYDRYFSSAGTTHVVPTFQTRDDLPIPSRAVTQYVVPTAYSSGGIHRSLTWFQGSCPSMVDGQTYTISTYARVTVGTKSRLVFQYGSGPYKSLHLDIANTSWKRYSWTFTYNEAEVGGESGTRIYIGINPAHVGTAELCGYQLEAGNKATDWRPAPEDVNSAIDTAQSTADLALANAECIVGTQTASTNAWTGRASFASLQDGQVIMYWLPYAGTSAGATLNLTLSGGNTTGAKNVYINNSNRFTTHITGGNMIQMVYRENVTIGTSTYTGWWVCRALNDNTYDRIRFNNVVKAKTAISASRLIVGDSGGYSHLVAGSVFDVDKPILWADSAIAVNTTGTNNYLSLPNCTLRNNAGSTWAATQYETLYLAGTLGGNVFTVASENWLTTAPANENLTYISLGYMYSTYQMFFYPEHPMYRLVNGVLKAVSQIAYEAQITAASAQSSADAARADFQRVVRIDDDGLHVGDNQSTGEVLIDSESVNVVVNGSGYSKFAGDYVQFGDYQLRRTSDGGLAFKRKE